MSIFFEAVEELKERRPEMVRAVNNIVIDLQSPENPFGISAQLVENLDKSVSDGHPLEETIRAHTTIQRPGFHTEAEVNTEHIKRVMSKHTFVRWHLGDGRHTASFTDASDTAWVSLEDIIETSGENLPAHVEARQSFETFQLKGTTGPKNAPVWWTWSEDGLPYEGKGEQYTAQLALTDNEISYARMDGLVVELNIPYEKHPEKLYRPTGLDSFFPDTRFYPNLNPTECFGRTKPMPPSESQKGLPEAVSAAIEYSDQLPEDTMVEVTFIKY